MRDIKYKSISCGPAGSFQPGDPRTGVPDDEAKSLVDGGYAEYTDAPLRATISLPPREEAIPVLGEQAVSPAQPPRNTQRRGR